MSEKKLKQLSKWSHIWPCLVGVLMPVLSTAFLLMLISFEVIELGRRDAIYYNIAAFTPLLAIIPHLINYITLDGMQIQKLLEIKKSSRDAGYAVLSGAVVLVGYLIVGVLFMYLRDGSELFEEMSRFVVPVAVILSALYFFVISKFFAPPGCK